jgi:hypothetical protein
MNLEVRKPRPGQEARPAAGSPTSTKSKRPSRAKHPWTQDAMQAIKQLILSGAPFTADSVRAMVGTPPEPRLMGAVFSGARSQGICEPTGAMRGDRGHLLRIWVRCPR